MLTRIGSELGTALRPIIQSMLGDLATAEEVAQELTSKFEVPKKLEHGHLALPVFPLAKLLRQSPPQIASDLTERAKTELRAPTSKFKNHIASIRSVGGYINFTMTDSYLQSLVSHDVLLAADVGLSQRGQGKTVVIDYSSPNMAKPMHVGHLRTTVIGQALCNMGRAQGFNIVALNYLGDWGVQFGKLAWAYQNWGSEYSFQEEDAIASLYQLYVRFHDEAQSHPEMETQAGLIFKRLEQGDPDIKRIWRMFVDITLAENQKIYDLLGVHFDLTRGESYHNEELQGVADRLQEQGLLVMSEGAQVVMLEEEGYPPCLIRKSDGTSLYATRDLASAIYRFEKLKADLALYVVAVDQSLHFQQVFSVLKRMGYPWVSNCNHVSFGLYRFEDKSKISTRKGNVVFLRDVIDRAVELTRGIVAKKNPDLPNLQQVAEQVGIGAVIFYDLVNDRIRNVEFSWEKVLDFEGDTGPYVQYCQVRCRSILRKCGKEVRNDFPIELTSPEERHLIQLLLTYGDALSSAWDAFKPNIFAQYLLDVCHAFSLFYQKHRVMGVDPDLESSRLTLVKATQKVVESGLRILNIAAPEVM